MPTPVLLPYAKIHDITDNDNPVFVFDIEQIKRIMNEVQGPYELHLIHDQESLSRYVAQLGLDFTQPVNQADIFKRVLEFCPQAINLLLPSNNIIIDKPYENETTRVLLLGFFQTVNICPFPTEQGVSDFELAINMFLPELVIPEQVYVEPVSQDTLSETVNIYPFPTEQEVSDFQPATTMSLPELVMPEHEYVAPISQNTLSEFDTLSPCVLKAPNTQPSIQESFLPQIPVQKQAKPIGFFSSTPSDDAPYSAKSTRHTRHKISIRDYPTDDMLEARRKASREAAQRHRDKVGTASEVRAQASERMKALDQKNATLLKTLSECQAMRHQLVRQYIDAQKSEHSTPSVRIM